ncbi:MAG: hypothetical protein P8Y38_09335 [Deltaproteobacteria bacterium]
MKELDALIKTVADGLKSMAQGVEKLAEKVEGMSESLSEKPVTVQVKTEKKAKAAAPAKKRALKKAAKKSTAGKKKPVTAADTVLTIIKRSRKGVDTNTLIKKTGYDRKKVANIVYKLKKQSLITSPEKGVYKKA